MIEDHGFAGCREAVLFQIRLHHVLLHLGIAK